MKAKSTLLASLILVNSSFSMYYALPVVEERGIPLDSDLSAPVSSSPQKPHRSELYKELSNSFTNLPQNKAHTEISKLSSAHSIDSSDNIVGGDDAPTIELNNQPKVVSKTNKLDEVILLSEQNTRQQDKVSSAPIVVYNDEKLTTALVEDNPIIDEFPDEAQQDNSKQNTEQLLRDLRSMPISERMHRVENIIEAQKSAHVENKIRLLQDEVQALRGQLEAERHKLEKALAQQKLLYEDLDRRFSQVTPDAKLAGSSNSGAQASSYLDSKHVQQDLYTEAYKNIRKRDYPKAIELFQRYIEKYPNGTFGANANYWLGEVYMLQSDYDKALAAFDQVLSKYAKDPKSADAMYKKGLVFIYQKDFDKAKRVLAEVKEKFKNTTAARLADKQLQGIETITNDA